jgi:hypothetical protein
VAPRNRSGDAASLSGQLAARNACQGRSRKSLPGWSARRRGRLARLRPCVRPLTARSCSHSSAAEGCVVRRILRVSPDPGARLFPSKMSRRTGHLISVVRRPPTGPAGACAMGRTAGAVHSGAPPSASMWRMAALNHSGCRIPLTGDRDGTKDMALIHPAPRPAAFRTASP